MGNVEFIRCTELNSEKKKMSPAEAADLLTIRMEQYAEELKEKDPVIQMYGAKYLEAYNMAIERLEKETFAYQLKVAIDKEKE